MKSLSLLRLSATPRTVAHQAPPFMGFSRQEYWRKPEQPQPDCPDLLLLEMSQHMAGMVALSQRLTHFSTFLKLMFFILTKDIC